MVKGAGHVYLVGAGPGDPELITVKGKRILEMADTIVYDYLAESSLLEKCTGEKIYVGKQGANHELPQDEINTLLVTRAREGKKVARLKGGDPYIFGRGAEEAEELIEAGIPFTVVPGVSSFYAAPAYAGIPVTHRDHASAFEVITGHRKANGEGLDINLPDYRENRTWIFLMAMKNLEEIAARLVKEKGFPETIPAAAISWGTRPNQLVAVAALAQIAQSAKEKGVEAPAIVIIGGVVEKRALLSWFEKLPLFGKQIVITRTREQSSRLAEILRDLGAKVMEIPTIVIRDKRDESGLGERLKRLSTYDWIVFTSQNAVRLFFQSMTDHRLDSRSLAAIKIAAIGPATADELRGHGIIPDLVPADYIAEGLIEQFTSMNISSGTVMVPCSAGAREALREGLERLGMTVDRVHIYDTVAPDYPPEILEEASRADLVTFTSSSTVENYFNLMKFAPRKAASIGPITSKTLRDHDHEPAIEAREYTIDGLVEAILEHYAATEVAP